LGSSCYLENNVATVRVEEILFVKCLQVVKCLVYELKNLMGRAEQDDNARRASCLNTEHLLHTAESRVSDKVLASWQGPRKFSSEQEN